MNKLFVIIVLTGFAGTVCKPARAASTNANVVVVTPDYLSQLADEMRTNHPALRAAAAMTNSAAAVAAREAMRADQLQADRSQLAHGQVSLNRLLNCDAPSPWPEFELPSVAGGVSLNPRLVEFALKYEPKTLVQQQVKQAEAMVAVTRRQNYPDVSAGFEARNYSGDGSFRQGMLILCMNLPWANNGKIRAGIRREQAKLSAAPFELADEQLAVREELHQLTVKVDPARREALLYRDQIIPRTKSARRSERGADHRLRRRTAPSTEMFHVSTCRANQRRDHHRGTRPRAGALGGGSASDHSGHQSSCH